MEKTISIIKEKLAPNSKLEPIALEEMSDIIEESNNVFLAPASNPAQSTEELLEAMRQDPGFTLLGYKTDGVPISYIVALSYKDPLTVSIGPMYVSAQNRGNGLGRKQVQDFNDRARQQGYRRVYTKTWLNNNASRKVFESLGFVEAGIKSGDRANGDSTISYILEL